jgi:hypothetical protein
MSSEVAIFKSKNFQNDVIILSFKENNLTYKLSRMLVEMIKAGHNISHLVKIEQSVVEKPLFLMKVKKDLHVVLSLEQNTATHVYTLTLLRAIRLSQVEEMLADLDATEGCEAYDFKEFWGY